MYKLSDNKALNSPSKIRGGASTPSQAGEKESPSKIRGGAALGGGGVETPAPEVTAPEVTSPVGTASGSINAPALKGTPSYPRGGFSTPSQAGEKESPSKIRGGAALGGGGVEAPATEVPATEVTSPEVTSPVGTASGSINAPALKGTPSYPRGGFSASPPRRWRNLAQEGQERGCNRNLNYNYNSH